MRLYTIVLRCLEHTEYSVEYVWAKGGKEAKAFVSAELHRTGEARYHAIVSCCPLPRNVHLAEKQPTSSRRGLACGLEAIVAQ
jgi:hypothetical protein